MPNRIIAAVLSFAYIASIWLAVVAIDRFGVVNILGTGLMAPAAVYVVGVTLVLRDLLQDHLPTGKRGRIMALLIAVGAVVSAGVNPGLALASGLAFLVSESLDFAVYTPIRERQGRIAGVAVSNAISIPVDSLIFLWLAFGSLQFLPGQVVGKAVATVLAIAILAALALRRR